MRSWALPGPLDRIVWFSQVKQFDISRTPLNTHFTHKNFSRPSPHPQTWLIGAFLTKNRHFGHFGTIYGHETHLNS